MGAPTLPKGFHRGYRSTWGYGKDRTGNCPRGVQPARLYESGPLRPQQETDQSQRRRLASRIALDGEVTGVFADYHYVGTGDNGGATDEESVKLLEAIVSHGEAVLPKAGYALGGEFTQVALVPC